MCMLINFMKERASKGVIEFVLCCVGHLLLAWNSSLRACFPSDSPLTKSDLSFASGYRLEIARQLGMGQFGLGPLLVQTLVGLVHADTVSVSSSVYQSLGSRKPLFLGVLQSLWLSKSFLLCHRIF